jgi:hypothetical protein
MIPSKRAGGDAPKALSPAALQDYRRNGYYFPVPALSAGEVAHYRGCLEKHEAKTGAPLQGNYRHKAHLLFTWVDEIVHHPRIVDAAEDVLGPDVLHQPKVSCLGTKMRPLGPQRTT